jgi:hypothetical protein
MLWHGIKHDARGGRIAGTTEGRDSGGCGGEAG